MVCKYCGEADPLKITMSTRMIKGRAVTIDVCFNCYFREKFAAEGENGNSLREFEEGIYDQSEFYELLRSSLQRGNGKFNKRDLL
jgi:hypothetical protein